MEIDWSNFASRSTVFFDQLYPEIGILVQGKRLVRIEKKCNGKPSESDRKVGKQFYELVQQYLNSGGEIDDLCCFTEDKDVLDLLKRVKTHQTKVQDRTPPYSKDGTVKDASFLSSLPSVSHIFQWPLSYIPSSWGQNDSKGQA